jgi:zinc transport system substrate-binding protein
VVASIYPLAALAAEVVGSAGEVVTLMPAGADPHAFEPTPQGLDKLGRAELLITVGLGFDRWAEQAADGLEPGLTRLRLAEMVEEAEHEPAHRSCHAGEGGGHSHPHEHAHTGPDPHLWLDPVLARRFVEELAARLIERFPSRRAALRDNRDQLVAALKQLDRDFDRELNKLANKRLLLGHAAFDRFAARYGLTVVGHLFDEVGGHGQGLTPAAFHRVVMMAREHDVPALYLEPNRPDRLAGALKRETGLDVHRLDPMGHPAQPGRDSYIELMRTNLQTLVKGQSGRQ